MTDAASTRLRRRELLRTGAGIAVAGLCPGILRAAGDAGPADPSYRLLADGLRFPEGPVALSDGSVLVVEIARGTLSRVYPGGRVEVVAELGGGPNGAAIGPDGACYVCNNGGTEFAEVDGLSLPVGASADHSGGWIERVDLETRETRVLYREAEGRRLSAPNDLVFDESGGFWFTDIGKSDEWSRDHGAICYARPDGSAIRRVLHPLNSPNGIVLSPDGNTLYVAELFAGRLLAFTVAGPGELADSAGLLPGRLVGAGPGRYLFDSMAVEADGTVCIAAPVPGEIVRFAPDGRLVETIAMPGPLPTNICFGGPGMRTAYVSLSGHGQLVAVSWPRTGAPPAFPG